MLMFDDDQTGCLTARGFMHESKAWKILQIIPAQVGWKAVHCWESTDNPMEIFNRAIVCWALVETIGETGVTRTQVRGIEQQANHLAVVEDLTDRGENGDSGADRSLYFLGYDDPAAHKESDYWIVQAKGRYKRERQTGSNNGNNGGAGATEREKVMKFN
jgi:hypothetical protein